METWLTITTAGLRASLSEVEWDVFSSQALVPGGSDPVVQAIRTVVAKVQGAVGASGRNTVGPAGTVPPELEGETYVLLMEELASRIPNSGLVFDKIREGRLTEAKALLKEIRSGTYQTTAPETIGTTGSVGDSGGYGGDDLINFGEIR